MDPATMFGPLDAILTTELLGVELIKYVLLVLVLANMATRFLTYRRNVHEYDEEDAEAPSRNPLHAATSILLILGAFYFATYEPHGGIVLSMLVLGTFITDFFEHEVRAVDMRQGQALRRPKGALVASLLALAYATFQLVNEFSFFVDNLSKIL